MLSKTVRAAGAAFLAALVTGAIAIAAADNDNSRGPSGNTSGPGAQAPGESDRGPNGSGEGPGNSNQGQGGPHRGPGGPPFLRNMTFAEVHTQKDGQEVVIRVDRGKVKSRTPESITITANNGSDVTIPTDSETRVRSPHRGKQGESLDSLKEGALVTIDRESGKAARVVALMPKHKQRQEPQGQGQQPQGQGQHQGPQQGPGQQSDGPPSGGPR